jgi:CRP-like cAMP-binding protein
LFAISRDEILNLEKSSTNWIRFLKFIAEQEYINMEKRILILQKEGAEKRYEDLLTNQPEYLQLIPLNYLSSYLGFTQRHLSRIRKSLSN